MTRSTGHATTASVYTGSQLCYLTPSCKHSRSNPMLRREFIGRNYPDLYAGATLLGQTTWPVKLATH